MGWLEERPPGWWGQSSRVPLILSPDPLDHFMKVTIEEVGAAGWVQRRWRQTRFLLDNCSLTSWAVEPMQRWDSMTGQHRPPRPGLSHGSHTGVLLQPAPRSTVLSQPCARPCPGGGLAGTEAEPQDPIF